MNGQLRRSNPMITTHAAENLPRRRWCVAGLEAMVAAGILRDDERLELIGGEVVPLSPNGNQHELLKQTRRGLVGAATRARAPSTLFQSEESALVWRRALVDRPCGWR